MAQLAELSFRPLNFGRWVIWGATAIVFIAAPQIFGSGFARGANGRAGAGDGARLDPLRH